MFNTVKFQNGLQKHYSTAQGCLRFSKVHVGPFQYVRLSFGLANAPGSFQRLLEHILHDYTGKFVIL